MRKSHPTSSDLELYVVGALSPQRQALVEAHVLSCASCALSLQREARMEAALFEVGRSLSEQPLSLADLSTHRARRSLLSSRAVRLGAMALCLSAAAAVVVVPRLREQRSPSLEVARTEVPSPLPTIAVGQEAPSRLEEDAWRAACPDPMNLLECRAAARRRGLFVLSGIAEESPRYEVLTGRAAVVNYAPSNW